MPEEKRPEKGRPGTGRRLRRRQGAKRKPVGDNDVKKQQALQEVGPVVPNA